MKYRRGIYLVLAFVLVSAGLQRQTFCQSETRDKDTVLRKVANDWIAVGVEEFERGMYLQAEKAFLAVREYYLHMNEEQRNTLNEYSKKTHKAHLEVISLSKKVDKARQLFEMDKLIEAKQTLEQIYESEYLTATQQEEFKLTELAEQIDNKIQSQRKKTDELFQSSVQAYRAGKLQIAKKAFAAVAENRLAPSPQRSAAEGYIERIDRLLEKEKTPLLEVEQMLELEIEPPKSQLMISTKQTKLPEALSQRAKPKTTKVKAKTQPPEILTQKEKLLRSYSQAVINDATKKTKDFIESGELYKAKQALRKAGNIIDDNKNYLGEELYKEYMQKLIDLARQIQQ